MGPFVRLFLGTLPKRCRERPQRRTNAAAWATFRWLRPGFGYLVDALASMGRKLPHLPDRKSTFLAGKVRRGLSLLGD